MPHLDNMNYKLLKIEKETRPGEDVYVAIIKKKDQEQPFRVTLEHFETQEEAEGRIKSWIQVQEEDDERAEKNKEADRLTALCDEAMNKLNNSL